MPRYGNKQLWSCMHFVHKESDASLVELFLVNLIEAQREVRILSGKIL